MASAVESAPWVRSEAPSSCTSARNSCAVAYGASGDSGVWLRVAASVAASRASMKLSFRR